MTSPSLNAVGGTAAVIALAVVLYFGATHAACPPDVAPKPATAVVTTTVTPVPAPAVAPPMQIVPKATPVKPPIKFRKVTKMDCSWVPAITKNYSKEQITAAAQQYGLSPAQVSALRACLN
jgi:hypothetical protein